MKWGCSDHIKMRRNGVLVISFGENTMSLTCFVLFAAILGLASASYRPMYGDLSLDAYNYLPAKSSTPNRLSIQQGLYGRPDKYVGRYKDHEDYSAKYAHDVDDYAKFETESPAVQIQQVPVPVRVPNYPSTSSYDENILSEETIKKYLYDSYTNSGRQFKNLGSSNSKPGRYDMFSK